MHRVRSANAFLSPSSLARQFAFRCAHRTRSSRTSVRNFHASQSARSADSVLNAVLTCPHMVLSSLHSIGLPWYASIPATALLVRAFVIFPFIQVPLRLAQQRLLDLTPLRFAKNQAINAQILRKHSVEGPAVVQRRFKQEARKADKDLRSRWGCSQSTFLLRTLGQLPIFVALAETIRRMAGAPIGLLGAMFSPFGKKTGHEGAGSENEMLQATSLNLSADGQNQTRVEQTVTAQHQPDNLSSIEGSSDQFDLAETATSAVVETTEKHAWFEPSFSDGGLLWFKDLTGPDPTLNLPFMVAGLMFANMGMSNSRTRKTDVETSRSRRSVVVQRTLQTMLLLMVPFLIHIPAGVLWYWASSTLCALLSNVALDFFVPFKKPVLPCKRPLIPLEKPAFVKPKRSTSIAP